MAIRDGGCRFPGCHRPPAYTDAHHIQSWATGGATDLGNGLLICRYHHRCLHEGDWRIQLTNPTLGPNTRIIFHGPNGQRTPSDPARL